MRSVDEGMERLRDGDRRAAGRSAPDRRRLDLDRHGLDPGGCGSHRGGGRRPVRARAQRRYRRRRDGRRNADRACGSGCSPPTSSARWRSPRRCCRPCGRPGGAGSCRLERRVACAECQRRRLFRLQGGARTLGRIAGRRGRPVRYRRHDTGNRNLQHGHHHRRRNHGHPRLQRPVRRPPQHHGQARAARHEVRAPTRRNASRAGLAKALDGEGAVRPAPGRARRAHAADREPAAPCRPLACCA